MTWHLERRARLTVIGCLLLCAAISGASLGARHRATDAATLKQQLKALANQKQRLRSHLKVARQQERQVNRQLAAIDAKLDVSEARLHGIKQNVTVARADLHTAVVRLNEATHTLDGRRDLVAERLVTLYQEGDIKALEILLQSRSFSDFSNRMYLVNEVVSRDAEVLDDLEIAQDRADQRRERVEDRKQTLESLQHQEENVRADTLDARQDTQAKKTAVLRDRLTWERALDELEANSREITAMLNRLQRRSKGRGGVVVTPWTGGLARPVSGRITSGFGYRMHPILKRRKMHTGVDLAASSGTPIHAAAGGVVVFSGWWGGYGNCVILDHGGGLATLYGHCSSLGVGEGQKVSQGQSIAYVGSTGLSTGPHLHFEVRRNGNPVNPMGAF